MTHFNHSNSATKIRNVLAKIALFGWNCGFNAQLRQSLVDIQKDQTERHPEIAPRAKLLAHILEDLPNDTNPNSRFASIRQNVEGLVRLIDDCFETPDTEPQASVVDSVRHKRTWRRILSHQRGLAENQFTYPGVMRRISQLLQDPHLTDQTRQSLGELMQDDPLLAQGESGRAKSALQKSTTETESSRPIILVAEDDPGCQAVMKMQLTTLGYDSVFAGNGTAAFGIWREGNFLAVFADLNMPGVDGLTLTRAIRAIESVRGGCIPIIAITAANGSSQLNACLGAGMNDVLPKPIELESMRELLARFRSSGLPAPVLESAYKPISESPVLDLEYLARIIGIDNLGHIPELMELFIRSARVDLQFCEELLTSTDGERIGWSMHKLKSSARMLGALTFARLAEALEAAMQAGQMIEAIARIEELRGALRHLECVDLDFAQADLKQASKFERRNAADLQIPEPVLIVDDDAVTRRHLRLLLNALGISQVFTSSSAPAGLIELRQALPRIQLLISDLGMSAMPGWEFLRHVADMGFSGDLLLICDADREHLASAVEVVRAMDMRLVGALAKPVTLDSLTNCFKISDSAASQDAATGHTQISFFDMSQAIRNDEFEIFFQPKVAITNLKPTGIVAKLNWQSRDRPVAVECLLTLADRYGLGEELFKLLLTKSLIGSMRIAEAGLTASLTVNLPARCLSDSTLPEFILASPNAVGFKADRLQLEITQAGLLSEIPGAWENLARLSMQGIRLSLGDLEPDFSALESACRIPFTEINLNLGVLRESIELGKPEYVTGFIDSAKACNLKVLADHVHTEDDLAVALEFGCDFFRGDLPAPAMPQLKMIEWLEANL